MGYRNYLYKIEKKKANQIRNMTYKELKDKYEYDGEYIDIFKILNLDINKDIVFEFGKLYWEDTVPRIQNTGKKLFKSKKLNEIFEDERPYIVGEEALIESINIYKDKIKNLYAELLEKESQCKRKSEKIAILEKHIKDYDFYWNKSLFDIVVLDKNENKICDSQLYEHLIWELVYQFKTIDFEKYDLIFLGW